MSSPLVAIIIGSKSDSEVMADCATVLQELGVASETHVMSAHRTPDKLRQYVLSAPDHGVEVFVAGAGMAAALPGVIAAYTTRPVIGVPIGRSGLNGMDSLLSIAQMPPGVPVACVAINGARNAGLLAAEILALQHEDVRSRLEAYRAQLAAS
ncbi:MAG TPA: 5-(carboxyamino)imidazole ribonucleotide mutase [Dehalococcoidia bacterium]|nr:5-(carboxyamino)imidazole ribonucleotide mutase [Dehalococcoidia bacterium]